jgi:tetratricopeptide (TPR) repeat protein
MPEHDPGQENIAALDEIFQRLEEGPRRVFKAAGAFFHPQFTAELIARFIAPPEVPNLESLNMQTDKPEVDARVQQAIHDLRQNFADVDTGPIENDLQILVDKGLLEALPAVEGRAVAHYRLTEAAYRYVYAQNTDEDHRRALEVCLSYARKYAKLSQVNFIKQHAKFAQDSPAILAPALNNLIHAATDYALAVEDYAAVLELADILYVGLGGGGPLVAAGDYRVALPLLDAAVEAAKRQGSKQREAAWLGNLGNTYSALGQGEQAITYYEQALAVAREIDFKHGEAMALVNLGVVHVKLGQIEQGINYYEQALAMARQTSDKHTEMMALDNLGLVYIKSGQVKKAINYYEQILAMARELGDKQREALTLDKLGQLYAATGQIKQALPHFEQHLVILRELGDKPGEGNVLGNLGNIHAALGQTERAIAYYGQQLLTFREIGDRRGEGHALRNLGNANLDLGQAKRAIDYDEQYLAITRETKDRQGEGFALGNLANAYLASGQLERSISYYEQSIAISREIGDKQSQANCLYNLSRAYQAQGDASRKGALYEKALEALKQARALFMEMKMTSQVELVNGTIMRVQAKLASTKPKGFFGNLFGGGKS